MVKAVIFDMDGVLLDTEMICLRSWKELAREFGILGLEDVFRQCIGTTHGEIRKIVCREIGEDFNFDFFEQRAGERFQEIARTEGIALKKGVRELLAYLKEKKIRIALASSTRMQAVHRELDHAKILDYFEILVTGDMVTRSKPDPEIYQKACEKLGILPNQAYAIEDSYHGVRSAVSCGLKTIMVPDLLEASDEMRNLAHVILPDLYQVIDFFESL